MLDGFIGFFEATLYKDVVLSTLPSTHTPEMYSWFPYFFPLKVCFVFLFVCLSFFLRVRMVLICAVVSFVFAIILANHFSDVCHRIRSSSNRQHKALNLICGVALAMGRFGTNGWQKLLMLNRAILSQWYIIQTDANIASSCDAVSFLLLPFGWCCTGNCRCYCRLSNKTKKKIFFKK